MEKVLSWREIFNITWINANKRVEELVFQGINTCLNEWEGLSVLIPSQLEMNITKFVIQGKNLIRNQGNNFLRKRAIFMKFWRKLQWHIMQLIRIFFIIMYYRLHQKFAQLIQFIWDFLYIYPPICWRRSVVWCENSIEMMNN